MKVLLAVPPRSKKKVFHILPPLGLGYISSALKKQGVEVELIDSLREKLNIECFIKKAISINPDIIGYQAFTSDVYTIATLIDKIKVINKDIIHLVGGYHPSCSPNELLQKDIPNADYGYIGEAEIGLPKFLLKLEKKQNHFDDIPGLIWRKNNEIKINSPLFYEDLDLLEMPDWKLINPLRYQNTIQSILIKKLPVAPIMATRGCPLPCTFCATHRVHGKKVRYRSVENVIAEMDYLNQEYGIKEFHFEDDNFTANRDYVIRFCNLLISKKRNYFWAFPNGVRLDSLDEEMLLKMKQAGCYYFVLGIESGSNNILKQIKKRITVEMVIKKIKLIKSIGILVAGFFIIGLPGETKSDIELTKKLIFRKEFFAALVFLYHPIPGSILFEELKQAGEIDDSYYGYKPDHSTLADAVYAPKGIALSELKKIHRKITQRYYLNPSKMLSILLSIKSIPSLYYFTKRALAYLFR